MSQLLIKFQADYADEFDVYGFAIISEEQWQASLKKAEKKFESDNEVERYFGTNEMIVWETFEEYQKAFEVVQISDGHAELLKTLFGTSYYGHFLTVD